MVQMISDLDCNCCCFLSFIENLPPETDPKRAKIQDSDHKMPSCVSAEETGVDLGQKKDSYFYSCCHNN